MLLQLPQDETVKLRRTRSEYSISEPPPNNTEVSSTTARHTYTGPKTLTSTGSSEGSVSTDDSHSSPTPTVLALTTLKEKPKIPPKPMSLPLKRRAVFLQSSDLVKAEVTPQRASLL